MKLTGLLLSGLLGVVPAAHGLELDALMHSLAARGSAAASFVEQQQLAALELPLESSGELSYQPPDELEKRTLTPRAEILRYSNGVVSTERSGRRTRLDLQRYPQILPFVESIRATLAGDRAALERLFELTLEGTERQWQLQLVPRAAQSRAQIREIRVAGSGADLLQLTIVRGNGDRTVTTMTPHAPR
jgi:hypothetical protein